MKWNSLAFFVSLFILLAFSCSTRQEKLTKDELEAYIADPENGLTKAVTSGKMKLEVSYRPTELVWYNDIKQMSAEAADSLLEQYKNRYYFVARYSNIKDSSMDPLSMLAGNKVLYQEILTNLSFRFHQYAKLLLNNGGELSAVGSAFSKSYGILPYNLVLFYFEDEEIADNSELTLSVSEIGFDLPLGNFTFFRDDIDIINTPILKL